jgi:hypothetical protein
MLAKRRSGVVAVIGSSDPVRCPQCGEVAVRVRRRPLDRVVSLVGLVWRFRCKNRECRWTGTVRMEPMRVDTVDTP